MHPVTSIIQVMEVGTLKDFDLLFDAQPPILTLASIYHFELSTSQN